MAKISIIAPVYNVEEYLPKFIESILAQIFTDYEFIIVDDGSTDSSGDLADLYADKDSRIKVLHKENGGAPSARNAGMDIAAGEYCYFPDSDDWLEPDYVQNLYDIAERTGAQLVVAGYKMEYYEKGHAATYAVSVPGCDLNTREKVRGNLHLYFDNMMAAVPWNKLYRADYLKSNALRWPNMKWDDLHFNMEVIKDIDHVVICSADGYHFYRSRVGSETTTVFDSMLYKKRKEQFEHILRVYDHWHTDDEEIYKVLYGYYAGRIVQCIQEIAVSDCADKKQKVSEILNDPLVQTALKKGEIPSKALRLLAYPMKRKWVAMSIVSTWATGIVKTYFPALFYRLKSKTVNKAIKQM